MAKRSRKRLGGMRAEHQEYSYATIGEARRYIKSAKSAARRGICHLALTDVVRAAEAAGEYRAERRHARGGIASKGIHKAVRGAMTDVYTCFLSKGK